MNKFRKILAGIAVAVGIGCLAGAAACTKAPKYYDLTFDSSNVDIVMLGDLAEPDENGNPFDALNGGKVMSGTQVRFTVSLGNSATGKVKVIVDGVEVFPDENGVYSFVIKKNSSVKIEGVYALYTLNLKCAERVQGDDGEYVYEERMFSYTDVDGNTLGNSVTVREDEDFNFKLNVTPYYIRENSAGSTAYSVICGSQELIPDNDGVYTVTNLSDVSEEGLDIYVSGMEQEYAFTERANCGRGTKEDPYLISRPIDMFYLAALTNLFLYNSIYGSAYYKLVADIDMEGAQMYVVGDYSDSGYGPSVFSGQFDGNGHTIKNFYITDEVIDQESYVQEYLPYLGLFGVVSATSSNAVSIKNLTLENCELRVHTGVSESTAYAGMLVGYGIGTQISGCTVKNAEINVAGSDSHQAFVGGMVGVLQAAYGTTRYGTVTYDSYVHASNMVDLTLDGTGSLRIAGGLVGYLISSDVNAISYISNSTVTGDVVGGMQSGGIVGVLGRFSSINNCYAGALVSASNDGMQYNEEYKYAYAGGIAGYADEDSLIYASYVANKSDIFASSVNGSKYQVKGDYAGYVSAGAESAKDSSPSLLINNKTNVDGTLNSQFDTLGWVAAEWNLAGASPISLVPQGIRTVKITVKKADGTTFGNGYTKVLGETRYTMSSWYNDVNIPEYLTDNGKQSYGYYFGVKNGKPTDRVPYGFVPSANEVVLYVGFVDYSEVAGDYYVQSAPRSNGAYIKLTADGDAIFRNGGLSDAGKYYYDGEKVTIPFSALAALSLSVEYSDGGKYSFVGTKIEGGNGLNFEGIAYVSETDEDGDTTQTAVELTFKAFKARAGISYGEYANIDQGISYTFNVGMNGYYKSATASDTFTYTIDGNVITATYSNGGGFTATLVGGVVTQVGGRNVTKKNEFNGTYKHSANSLTSFTFDGLTSVNGVDYKVEQGRATFEINNVQYEAYFNQEGFLVINGLVYYPADGFTGEWYFDGVSDSLEKIEIALEGISNEGFGYATITYVGGTSVRGQYDVVSVGGVNTLRIYSGDMQYGELTLDTATGVARGIFFSATDGGYYGNVTFNLYDNFKGIWVTNEEGIDTVIFNGKSATGIKSVVLRAENGAITHGEYTLTTSEKGTLTVGSDVYELIYNEIEGKIELKKEGSDKTLAQRDGWYGAVLYDGETTYTFDGKGYIGGKVTVSDGSTLGYKIENGVVTMGGQQLVAAGSGFTYNGKTLVFKTGFAGEWLVGGTLKKLNLTEVSADFTAKATFEGEIGEFSFVYSPADGTLTLKEIFNGQLMITVLKKNGTFELSLSRTGDGDVSLNCILASRQDSYKGVYTGADGSSWTFDGLGNCVNGNGTAIYTAVNGSKTTYYYKLNELGAPYISRSGWVFTTATEGFKKAGEEQAYNMVTPDYMYRQRVFSYEGDSRVIYIFDGCGGLYRDDNGVLTKAYDYRIVDATTVTLTKDGKKYTGKLTDEGADKRLTIS